MTMNLYLVEQIMSSPDNTVRVELHLQRLRSMHLLRVMKVLREVADLDV